MQLFFYSYRSVFSDAIHGLSTSSFDGEIYQPSFWLGYTGKRGVFKNLSGVEPTYTNWNTDEPTNSDDCVGVTKVLDWKWNGMDCNGYQYVVCQGMRFFRTFFYVFIPRAEKDWGLVAKFVIQNHLGMVLVYAIRETLNELSSS